MKDRKDMKFFFFNSFMTFMVKIVLSRLQVVENRVRLGIYG